MGLNNLLSFNLSKFILWVFTVYSTVTHTVSQYTINGHRIKESSSCKDLGIVFTNTLTWQEHYEMISAKAYQALGLLRRVFENSQNPQTRKCLYISLVWATVLLWKPYLLKDIESLERVWRRATKFILSDYSSDYRTRLMKIGVLPLMYVYEIADILFLLNPSSNHPTSSLS